MSKKLLHAYKNGNAEVRIYSDGTRICETEDDEFQFNLPMNMDIKISNYCTKGCPFCHEQSNPQGKHAPMENFDFIESWQAGCEAALGGGMVTTHPQLVEILNRFKRNGIIANTTVHQDELIDNFDQIQKYQLFGLIHGIGVSLSNPSDKLAECVNKLDHVVLHVINGIFTEEQYEWIKKNIKKPKILLLGMKNFGRGVGYLKTHDVTDKQQWLYKKLPELIHEMNVVSFDNLALKQLDVKRLLTDAEWNLFYQGDEGTSNMYIDAVEGKFAQNSTSVVRYDLKNDVKEMFDVIKKNSIQLDVNID